MRGLNFVVRALLLVQQQSWNSSFRIRLLSSSSPASLVCSRRSSPVSMLSGPKRLKDSFQVRLRSRRRCKTRTSANALSFLCTDFTTELCENEAVQILEQGTFDLAYSLVRCDYRIGNSAWRHEGDPSLQKVTLSFLLLQRFRGPGTDGTHASRRQHHHESHRVVLELRHAERHVGPDVHPVSPQRIPRLCVLSRANRRDVRGRIPQQRSCRSEGRREGVKVERGRTKCEDGALPSSLLRSCAKIISH